MKGIDGKLSGAAILLIAVFIAGTAVASGTAPLKPGLSGDTVQPLNEYLAQVRQSGMINMQTTDQPKRPPALDMDNTNEEEYPTERKGVLKAFVYSAVVPGAGQLYTGSKVKAAAFFSVEVAAWAGYFVFHGKGDDRTDIFETFADNHWSQIRYEDFIFANFGVRDDEDAYQNSSPAFTHHLPDSKTQQYYEMIGKYDQFVFGWDDVDTLATPPTYANLDDAYSAHRMHYEDLRHDANVMYGRATASLIVMMANHIISGAEAALAARNHNKKVQAGEQRLSFRAVTATIDDNSFPMLTMTYKF
jgi:hypothetical protein